MRHLHGEAVIVQAVLQRLRESDLVLDHQHTNHGGQSPIQPLPARARIS